MTAIIAYNLHDRTAVADDGTVVAITNLIDEDGDETDDLDEAVVFVCGNDTIGWFSEAFADFGGSDQVTFH